MEKVARALLANGEAENMAEAMKLARKIASRLAKAESYCDMDYIMQDYGLEPDYIFELV